MLSSLVATVPVNARIATGPVVLDRLGHRVAGAEPKGQPYSR
jgi:hypothetical protein